MKDTLIAIPLLILLALIVNPLHWWMPSMFQMLLLIGMFITFSVFAVFILREHPLDEREGLHRMLAGRSAFLAGGTILMIGIVVQELHDSLDVWLVYALITMIIAKLATYRYNNALK